MAKWLENEGWPMNDVCSVQQQHRVTILQHTALRNGCDQSNTTHYISSSWALSTFKV